MTFHLAARPSAPKTPTRSIVFLAFAGYASQAQVRVTDSLLPQIAADLGTSVGLASIVVTGYVVAHGSTQLQWPARYGAQLASATRGTHTGP